MVPMSHTKVSPDTLDLRKWPKPVILVSKELDDAVPKALPSRRVHQPMPQHQPMPPLLPETPRKVRP